MIAEQLLQNPVVSTLDEAVPGALLEASDALGELTVIVDAARILEVSRHLKDQQKFVRLSTVTAVDWHPADPRFEVVYHLQSVAPNMRLRVKCRVTEAECEIDSVTSVWRSANWYERETFDMFGIRFRNHPDLHRILMPEDWEGHPLRKDYPVHGHKYGYQGE